MSQATLEEEKKTGTENETKDAATEFDKGWGEPAGKKADADDAAKAEADAKAKADAEAAAAKAKADEEAAAKAKAPVKGDGKDDQRQKSLDGILRSERAKQAELAKKLAEREAELTALKDAEAKKAAEAAKADSGKAGAVKDEDVVARLLTDPRYLALEKDGGKDFTEIVKTVATVLREDYEKKFGTLSAGMEKKIAEMSDKMSKEIAAGTSRVDAMEPAIEAQRAEAQAKHLAVVEDAHPGYSADFEADDAGNVIGGAWNDWMTGHPYEATLREIARNGSTAQVVRMIDDFKRETGRAESDDEKAAKAEKAAKKEKALRDMAGSSSGTKKPVSIEGADKKGGTFEDGWNAKT